MPVRELLRISFGNTFPSVKPLATPFICSAPRPSHARYRALQGASVSGSIPAGFARKSLPRPSRKPQAFALAVLSVKKPPRKRRCFSLRKRSTLFPRGILFLLVLDGLSEYVFALRSSHRNIVHYEGYDRDYPYHDEYGGEPLPQVISNITLFIFRPP